MFEHQVGEQGASAAESGGVLVVGATRILRPAVRTLAARGARVTAVARDAAALDVLAREHEGRVRPLAADVTTADLGARLRRAAGPDGFSGAVVYAPTAPARTVVDVLRPLLPRGPLVLLLTSEWAAPAPHGHARPAGPTAWTPDLLPPALRARPACRPLVLGWRRRTDGARWHTPEEISAAALELLDTDAGTSAVLGTVRPWADRPA
ncbi:hypothetical protein [Streptomyces sp. NPDC008150]|uniref:hypothetical protein n=1 Tax=Streptomyces sp. NPDC008150 TaxID=3364816 RepID=UPI0036E6D58F